ncbi:MAG TPA: hypothetical protein VGM21_09535 [Actinomycetota bacterium]
MWNNLVKLGMPLVALGLLVLAGYGGGALAPVAAVGVAVFALALAGLAVTYWLWRRSEGRPSARPAEVAR